MVGRRVEPQHQARASPTCSSSTGGDNKERDAMRDDIKENEIYLRPVMMLED